MYRCGEYFTQSEIEQFEAAVRTMCSSLAALHSLVRAQGLTSWKVLPKLHQLIHVLEHWFKPTLRNPRFCMCYAGEDLVGIIK
eukprot:5908727-Alexandrium_andersonii.AAC.1